MALVAIHPHARGVVANTRARPLGENIVYRQSYRCQGQVSALKRLFLFQSHEGAAGCPAAPPSRSRDGQAAPGRPQRPGYEAVRRYSFIVAYRFGDASASGAPYVAPSRTSTQSDFGPREGGANSRVPLFGNVPASCQAPSRGSNQRAWTVAPESRAMSIPTGSPCGR
jgi:hypothetical protein